MGKHRGYYVPRTKRELVSFLKVRYPGVDWAGRSKGQLYAIYFEWMEVNGA